MLRSKSKYTSVGGQALIEGIMMKGKDSEAIAVRKKDGTIHVEVFPVSMNKWYRKTLFIRGVCNFISQMTSGYKYMMKSAEISGMLDDDEEDYKEKDGEEKTDSEEKDGEEKETVKDKFLNIAMTVGSVLGIALFFVLFMFAPTWAFSAIKHFFAGDITELRSLFEGILRMIIFILYMWATSFMADIRTTYEYHGAEHKTIAAFEGKEPLIYENIKNYRRFHPRCGTSFIFLVLAVSIIFYSVVPVNSEMFMKFFGMKQFEADCVRVGFKLLFAPVLIAISYEIIRLAGKYDNILTRAVSAPGMWLQRLTTREPNEKQVEIAVAALNAVLPKDENCV